MKKFIPIILFTIIVIVAGCKKDEELPGPKGQDGSPVIALRDTFSVFFQPGSSFANYFDLVGQFSNDDLVLVYILSHELWTRPYTRFLLPLNDGAVLNYAIIGDDGTLKLYAIEEATGLPAFSPPFITEPVRVRYEVIIIRGEKSKSLRLASPIDYSNYEEVIKRYNLE